MSESKRVALLMALDVSFCRDVIRGIRRYATGRRNWVFQNGPPEPSFVRAFRRWRPHGIIAQLLTPKLTRDMLTFRRPLVDTACAIPNLKVPVVDVDHKAVGILAAEHFLERGYRYFGFFGSQWAYFCQLREASFRMRLADAGYTVSSCYEEYLLQPSAITEWEQATQRVRHWLRRLPKPVGILASNDIPARHLADVCLQLGLRVPDEVALLGVDNDDLDCGLTSPPLSSVAVPAQQIGYEAAKILDALMSGKSAPQRPVFLPPVGVVTRQSTDTSAIRDPAVLAALQFIRKHAGDEIGVDDVVAHAALGRRMLEYKFRQLLGRTVLEEIRRVRITQVKQLLSTTDLPMPAIGRQTGFTSPQRLAVVFRQATGLTPSEYRHQTLIRGE
jgi:LacI family transcriptional regulator